MTSEPTLLIRPATSVDLPEWLRMRLLLWPGPVAMHQTEMTDWLTKPAAVVLVAERPAGAGLAGFAEVGTRSVADGCDTSPVGYLEGWYVDDDVRRQGVGAALVRAAEAWGRAQGYREFASDALLTNIVSQRAHEALGFEEVDRVVVYRKGLYPSTS